MTSEIFEQYGKNPVTLCKNWLSEAEKLEINDPEAICLATCDAQGQPSARMVLVKQIDETGLKFHSNEESQKGSDIKANPKAEMCFYWKSTRKQIRVSGRIEQVSDAESDKYFTTRPRTRQIGAWASAQSRPYETQQELADALAKYEQDFDEQDIPRPPYWKGFRLIPSAFEFWIGQKDRVHTRFKYSRQNDGTWDATWLYP